MRALVIDDRLETVAGIPEMDVTAPRVTPAVRTIIFAGRHILGLSRYLIDLRLEGATGYAYLTQGSGQMQQLGVWTSIAHGAIAEQGEVVTAIGRLPSPLRATVGQRMNLAETWTAPMRAVAYAHALTDAEAHAVARHLSLSLSLSLSLRLTPTPHPHTQATTQHGRWQHEGRTHRPAQPVACGDGHPIRIQYRDANVRWPPLGVADDCTASRARYVPRATLRTILPVLHRARPRRPHSGRVVREFGRASGPRSDRDSQPAMALRLHVQRERGHATLGRAHRLTFGGVS